MLLSFPFDFPGLTPESFLFLSPNYLMGGRIAKIFLKKCFFPEFLAYYPFRTLQAGSFE